MTPALKRRGDPFVTLAHPDDHEFSRGQFEPYAAAIGIRKIVIMDLSNHRSTRQYGISWIGLWNPLDMNVFSVSPIPFAGIEFDNVHDVFWENSA
jgi:hypothetical protein